jgi:hypothetical protein
LGEGITRSAGVLGRPWWRPDWLLADTTNGAAVVCWRMGALLTGIDVDADRTGCQTPFRRQDC